MSERLIVSITGHPGTGKTTLANELSSAYGINMIEGSSVILDYARRHNIPLEGRENYDRFHRYMQWQQGLTWLTDQILEIGGDKTGQSGLRSRPQFRHTKSMGGLVIATHCPKELAVDRINLSRPEDPITIEEYQRDLMIEESNNEYGTHTEWCIKNADYSIDNSGPLTETREQLASCMAIILANR